MGQKMPEIEKKDLCYVSTRGDEIIILSFVTHRSQDWGEE
jgi:hypothetical protein